MQAKHLAGAALLAGLFTGGATFAAAVASDTASSTAYDDGWQTGDNGGTGFGAWTLYSGTGDNGAQGFYIGDSANNDAYGGAGSGNINTGTPARAFGLYDFSAGNGATSAYRTFNGALTVGQAFKVGLDNGGVDAGRRVGFELRDVDGVRRFAFSFLGDGNEGHYELNGSTSQLTTSTFTTHGAQTTLTLTGIDTYAFTVAYNGSVTETFTGTLGGVAGNGIANVLAFNDNSNGGSNNDAFINSLAIVSVPEPVSLATVSVGGLLLLRRRRNA